MRPTLLALAASAALLLCGTADAATPYRGMLLYDMYCHDCHMRSIHFRPRSKVKTLHDLHREIERWQAIMRLNWQNPEVADVQAYLNWLYYHLPRE